MQVKNPEKRLGAKRGAEDIKAHPWFKDLDFNMLRHEPPPFVPQASGDSGAPPPNAAFKNF